MLSTKMRHLRELATPRTKRIGRDEPEADEDDQDEEPAAVLPCRPTKHWPGSEGKVEVIAARYAAGQSLWHPGDATNNNRIAGQFPSAFTEPDLDFEDDLDGAD